LSDADIAAISQTVVDDAQLGSILGNDAPGATAMAATGSTHTNTTLDTLVATGTITLAWLTSALAVGPPPLVVGAGIPPGTFVTAFNGTTTVTLSQAATATASGVRLWFVPANDTRPALDRTGRLWVPRRGFLTVLPGDVVAVDTFGAVILVPGNMVSATGSVWTFT
jgi:hypothetical protein